MVFISSLLGAASYFDFPRDLGGWGVLLGTALAWAVVIWRLWRYHPPWSGGRWLLLAGLAALTPVTSLFAGVQLPVGGALPPPGTPLQPSGAVMMFFSALPWGMAAGFLGPLPAGLLAGASGFLISLFQGHNAFIPMVYAFCGALLSAAVRQNFRTQSYRILRHPLAAGAAISLVYGVFYAGAMVVSTGDTLAVRLDYAISLLPGALAAFGGQMTAASVLTEVIALGWQKSWYGEMNLEPSPGERSLESRLTFRLAPFVLALLAVLVVGIWLVTDNATRQMLQSRMQNTAETAANSLPFSLETGQNLIGQMAEDERLYTTQSQTELTQILIEYLNNVPFFHQLTLLDAEGSPMAGYPVPDFQSTFPTPEELRGVDLALKGVAFQSYSLPPQTNAASGRLAFIATVRDGSNQLRGVLVGRTNLTENPFIKPAIDNLHSLTGVEGIGMLVDEEGMILYHPEPSLVGTYYEGEIGEASFDPAHIAPDGTRQMLYVQPVPGRSWATITVIPAEVAQQTALENAVPLLGMFLGITMVGYAILRVGLGVITNSIQELVSESERIAEGNLEHAMEAVGEDEVGRLGQSLEQMRVNLKARMEEVNRLLFVSRGVASTLEMEAAVKPILEGALATGASSARLVLTPAALPDIVQDVPTQYGLGPSSEAYKGLDGQLLLITEKQPEVVLTNPKRARLENASGMPAALMALALRHENIHYGTLWVGYDAPHKFTEEETRFLSAVAGQAALAASNARLYLSAQLGRQRLEAILASTPDPVLVTDHRDRLLLANPAALTLFGDGTGLSSGTPLEKIVKQQELLDLLNNGMAAEAPRSVEVRFPDNRVFYATASPVLAEDQVMGRVCVLSDITQFKELDALKTEFVSTVSHDLRSPLTLMRGYATMLQMVGELNEQQTNYIHKIETGVENMSLLVNNLLDLGRIDAGIGLQVELVPIVDLTRQVTEAMHLPAVQKQIELRLHAPEGQMPLVECDQPLLYQAITNLVDNAIKYTEAGGKVDVMVREAGANIELEVKDTGIGVAPVDLPRLFERFFRAGGRKARLQSGTGLGLALVKSIIERHGGRVRVESQLGKGSTFTLSIPQRQEAKSGKNG